MRLLFAALPSLLLAVSAKQAGGSNDNNVTSDDELWRRVRIGGGAGGDPPSATSLFLVGDASLAGGCSSQTGDIDGWLTEARLLHQAVETAYSQFSTNKVLAVMFNNYLGIQFSVGGTQASRQFTIKPSEARKWGTIGSRISGVTQFLDGGGLKNPQKAGEAPRVFCSGDATEYAGWDTVIKNERAEDIPLSKDDETGEVTEYLTLRKTFGDASASAGDAFFFPSFNGYSIAKTQAAHPGQICGQSGSGYGRYALTSKQPQVLLLEPDEEDLELGKANRHVLFCPKTFDPGTPAQGDSHAYSSLADAVSSANYPSGGSGGPALDKILPRSATLYHELYHLTDNGDTGDPYYKLNDALAAASGAKVDVLTNPESFTYFAMACYMYLNPPEGKDAIMYMGGLPTNPSIIPF